MPGPEDDEETEDRKCFVPGNVPEPMLLARDTKNMFEDSGQQVTARCREHNGVKKLPVFHPDVFSA